MKKNYISILSFCMAAAMLAGCSQTGNNSSSVETTTTTEPIVTLAPEPAQVINETPATYKSVGADKTAKEKFEEKIDEQTEIPVINVTTKEGDEIVSLDNYVSCVVDVFSCDDSMKIDEASAGIKVRGNSSAFYGDVNQILNNTVPYRIKFDSKTNMLGLNNGAECKSWVLLKSDWDLIRNDIAFRFGRGIIGDDAFCSDSTFVHLYVNDEFQGIYLLCEQCQVQPNRVDISEPEEGYTGTDIGYYLEMDNNAERETINHYFTVDYDNYAEETDIEGTTRKYVDSEYSIKNDVYSQNQIDFIDEYTNNLFKIIYEACHNQKYYTFDKDYKLVEAEYTNAKDTVEAVLDLPSVVDMYILYEIVHDYDCGEGSFYMCVDLSADSKCPKMKFTSPWDFNWAYNDSTNKYYAGAFNDESFVNQNGDRSNPWFITLMTQDWFVDMVKDKYTTLNENKVLQNAIKEEINIIETYKTDLNKTDEWATDCSYQLLEWIYNRIDWMDDTFIK